MNTKAPHIQTLHSFAGAVCAGAIVLLATTTSAQAQYNYTILDAPGATTGGTEVRGISGNNIVGYYTPGGGGIVYGFLYDGSSYTTLNSGTAHTQPLGVSGNNVVGEYYNGSIWQGFLATPVPEPSMLVLLAIGAAGFLVRRR